MLRGSLSTVEEYFFPSNREQGKNGVVLLGLLTILGFLFSLNRT